MKALKSLFLLFPLLASAQGIPRTTPYTRDWLLSTNATQARDKLQIGGGTGDLLFSDLNPNQFVTNASGFRASIKSGALLTNAVPVGVGTNKIVATGGSGQFISATLSNLTFDGTTLIAQPSGASPAGSSTEAQYRFNGTTLGAMTNFLYDTTYGVAKVNTEKDLQFGSQSAPFFLGVKSATFNGLRDDIFILGFNQHPTNTGATYQRIDTSQPWWRMDIENQVKTGAGYIQSEHNLDWGTNDANIDRRLLQMFVNQTNKQVQTWFAADQFNIMLDEYPYMSQAQVSIASNMMTVGHGVLDTNTTLHVSSRQRAINQQILLESDTTNRHTGIIGYNLPLGSALNNNYAWMLFGGMNNYVSSQTNEMGFYLGSSVPDFALRWSPNNLDSGGGVTKFSVNSNGLVGIVDLTVTNNATLNTVSGHSVLGSLQITNAITAQSGTISNIGATKIVGTDSGGAFKGVALTGLTYDGTTLANADATFVNATNVLFPNFTNTSTAVLSVNLATNIGVNPTNLQNAHISASAAIARSKLATGSANHVVVNDGTGAFSSEAQLALSRGGTAANLSDPNADRIMFWDDSAGQVDWLSPGTGLSISGTTLNVTVSGSPGGSDTQVQFNDSSNFGGDAGFTYNKTTHVLNVTNQVTANKLQATNDVSVLGSGVGILTLSDTDASNTHKRAANGTITTNIYEIGPAFPDSGIEYSVLSAATNYTKSILQHPAASGRQLLSTNSSGYLWASRYKSLKFSSGSFVLVDNAGCTIPNTNDFTLNTFMVPTFSGTAASNANYIRFMCRVPSDLDAAQTMYASITVELTGADTAAHSYHVGVVDVANSAVITGSASTFIDLAITGDGSGADTDIESVNDVTLTGWAAALTPKHWMMVELRRNGADASTVASRFRELEIFYAATQ